jgi:hypothetical protein
MTRKTIIPAVIAISLAWLTRLSCLNAYVDAFLKNDLPMTYKVIVKIISWHRFIS